MTDYISSFSTAVVSALVKDLPDIVETRKKYGTTETYEYTRRPHEHDINVMSFVVSWPNTSIGFDARSGLAGQAFTSSLVTIVDNGRVWCVYSGPRLLYSIDGSLKGGGFYQFMDQIRQRHCLSQSQAIRAYGDMARIPE